MPTARLAFPGGNSTRPRCGTARRPAVAPAQTASTALATPTAPASDPAAVADSDRTAQGSEACVVAGAARGYLVNDPR